MGNLLIISTFFTFFLASCSAQYEQFGFVKLGTILNEKAEPGEIYISADPVTWESAQNDCDSAGLKIVGIQSARKDSDLRKIILERGYETIWTSGNDREENNQYFWNDNMTPINWSPWKFNANLKPRDIGRSCLLFQSQTGSPPSVSTKPWDEEFCGNYHPVACEL